MCKIFYDRSGSYYVDNTDSYYNKDEFTLNINGNAT